MKRFLLLIVLLFTVFSEGLYAQDAGIRFSSISGEVNVRPDENPNEWQPADLHIVLKILYHVKTGDDSSAILSFADMSTFVLKAESEVVLATPVEKNSKIQLVAGNIWVNTKKMFNEGTMQVEMNQAIAGIKGTNITCRSNLDGSENRVQVLRGLAEVLIKATKELIPVKEGEELIIKKGEKVEKIDFDVDAVKESWKEVLSNLGDTIELNEVPTTLQNIMTAEAESFKGVQDEFKEVSAAETPLDDDIKGFVAQAERFQGQMMEDEMILVAIQQKIDHASSLPDNTPAFLSQLSGYQKQLATVKAQLQGYQAEIAKMLKEKFLKGSSSETSSEDLQELAQLVDSVESAWADAEFIIREAEGSSGGFSQEWFRDAIDKCNNVLEILERLSDQVQDLISKNPAIREARELLQRIGKYQAQLNNLMKNLVVIEIDSNVTSELVDSEKEIADSIQALQAEINAFYSLPSTGAEAESRLKASLSILNNFQKARRQYINSQRLYDSIVKAASGQKYKTSELEEITETYNRISDSFQNLGIAAEELQGRITELEDQLNTFLK